MTRATLSVKEKFHLIQFVQAHYVESKLGDAEFAALAAKELSLPRLNKDHISGIREEFEILSNRVIGTNRHTVPLFTLLAEVEKRLAEVERRLQRLEDRVEVYVKGSRGDSKATTGRPL